MSSDQSHVSTSIAAQDAAQEPSRALSGPQRRRRQARSLRKLRERLPSYTPSPRHLEIFDAVMFRHKHQIEVACLHNISQQRVSKIVRQVTDWVAAWGGDQARYALQERCRVATFVATKELQQLMRDVQFEISLAGQEYHWTRTRHDGSGERQWVDRSTRLYPKPAALYRILLHAILASARFNGAGKEFDAPPEESGASQPPVHNTQSMVLRAEINVNQPASAPPTGELYVDNVSESTCARGPSEAALGNEESPRP